MSQRIQTFEFARLRIVLVEKVLFFCKDVPRNIVYIVNVPQAVQACQNS